MDQTDIVTRVHTIETLQQLLHVWLLRKHLFHEITIMCVYASICLSISIYLSYLSLSLSLSLYLSIDLYLYLSVSVSIYDLHLRDIIQI